MMPIEECQEHTKDLLVKFEEKGRKATFRNSLRAKITKTKFDGCVTVSGPRADWVVSKSGLGDIIIELKGRDVDHAVKQVHATAKYWKSSGLNKGKLAGLIVCRQYPKASTAVQKAQNQFRVDYNGYLYVVTKNEVFEFEHVFSPNGPLKA